MFKSISWVLVITVAILIKLFSLSPEWVERYYSNGFYLYISRTFRLLFGWLPFSAGDILYAFIVIWLIKSVVQLIRKSISKQMNKQQWIIGMKKSIFYILCIYIVFNICWGLNYNRVPVAKRWQLKNTQYNTAELLEVLQIAVTKINVYYPAAAKERAVLQSKKRLFAKAAAAFDAASKNDLAFQYRNASVKPSIYSLLGCYMGYTGYYNPFTGEAQVNTMAPIFTLPFTTCHEIGHQLGYAKENEANFAGFMSARNSEDAAFRYAIYLELYLYGARDLYLRDTAASKHLYSQLNEGTKKDLQALRNFNIQYKNPIEPYIRKMYGQYLKANEQPKGLMSYNEVIAMVIAYGRRYGFSNI